MLFVVENWEIEWNSSMMEHGPDLGTAEFIFAKGGSLADFNYVMFGVNDSTYEPLIKAVAKRDNSHPDLIRKQTAQAPYTVPEGRMPAVQVGNTAAVRGQSVRGRDVTGTNRAFNAAAAGERVRDADAARQTDQDAPRASFGDLAQAGLYGRAAAQGVRSIMGAGGTAGRAVGAGLGAAGSKVGGAMASGAQRMMQSGAAQRMGEFMGNLRHVPKAYRQTREASKERRLDEARRTQLEQQQRMAGADAAALGRLTGSNPNARDRMRSDAEMASAQAGREIEQINERLAQPKGSFRQRVRDLGQQRRGEQRTSEEQGLLDAREREMVAQRAAAAEEGLDENDPALTEDAITEGGPVTETPPDTGVVAPREAEEFPDLSEDEMNEPAPPVAAGAPAEPAAPAPERRSARQQRGQPAALAAAADADPRVARFDELAARPDDGDGYGPSSISGKNSSYAKLRGNLMGQGIDPNDPSTITQAALDAVKIPKSAAAQAFIERLRQLNPALVEAAAQGDTAAAEEVKEEAVDAGVVEDPMGDPMAFQLSEDDLDVSWDRLLKNLNVR